MFFNDDAKKLSVKLHPFRHLRSSFHASLASQGRKLNIGTQWFIKSARFLESAEL